MHYIDPDGPIADLREEMVALTKQLVEKTSDQEERNFFNTKVIPLLRTNDEYLRMQARTIMASARECGIKVEVPKH